MPCQAVLSLGDFVPAHIYADDSSLSLSPAALPLSEQSVPACPIPPEGSGLEPCRVPTLASPGWHQRSLFLPVSLWHGPRAAECLCRGHLPAALARAELHFNTPANQDSFFSPSAEVAQTKWLISNLANF